MKSNVDKAEIQDVLAKSNLFDEDEIVASDIIMDLINDYTLPENDRFIEVIKYILSNVNTSSK